MKKIFVIAILGLAGLGFTIEQASAGPIKNCLCCKKCCVKMCAKQYNAFSPYCLDSLSGCIPMGGFVGGNGGGACCYGADGMGELPAPAAHAFAPTMVPGENAQAWSAWAPGMVNPMAVPGFYPTTIAPAQGFGR